MPPRRTPAAQPPATDTDENADTEESTSSGAGDGGLSPKALEQIEAMIDGKLAKATPPAGEPAGRPTRGQLEDDAAAMTAQAQRELDAAGDAKQPSATGGGATAAGAAPANVAPAAEPAKSPEPAKQAERSPAPGNRLRRFLFGPDD